MNRRQAKWAWLMTVIVVGTVLLAASTPVYGQAATYARLVGTIEDQTGALLPGVEVIVTARATNVPKVTVSNDGGITSSTS